MSTKLDPIADIRYGLSSLDDGKAMTGAVLKHIEAALAELEANYKGEVEELEAVLWGFMQERDVHTPGCEYLPFQGEPPCTCGLNAAEDLLRHIRLPEPERARLVAAFQAAMAKEAQG